ncbi:MAG: response regulator [Candidatus Hydrogenedentes bacterium]|nr:response regulator [Candidatus Hydrogenedentota bacterium]
MQGKRLHVVVIDDDPEIVAALSAFLCGEGHHVRTGANGHDGLIILQNEAADLVITDGEMAEMDGFEFIARVRGRYPKIGIILMTAHEGRYPLAQALKHGADGYITKPFSLKKFSLIFQKSYWAALDRVDWWDALPEAE